MESWSWQIVEQVRRDLNVILTLVVVVWKILKIPLGGKKRGDRRYPLLAARDRRWTGRENPGWRAPLGRSIQERDQHVPAVRRALAGVLDQESHPGGRGGGVHQDFLTATERARG